MTKQKYNLIGTKQAISTVFSFQQQSNLIKQVKKHSVIHPAGLNVVATCMITADQSKAIVQLVSTAMSEGNLGKTLDQTLFLKEPQPLVTDKISIFSGARPPGAASRPQRPLDR